MKVIFLYANIHGAGGPSKRRWLEERPSSSCLYGKHFPEEGIGWLISELCRRHVIDDYIVVHESTSNPGVQKLPDGKDFWTLPHIDDLKPFIKAGDIILARGGFKSWIPFLINLQKSGHWIVFYEANTGRTGWPYWDVILNDLIDKPTNGGGRLHLNYSKPVVPTLFFPTPLSPKRFDVIVNASHIHDRKGQYKVVQAAIFYRRLFGEHLQVVIPGGFYSGTKTNAISRTIVDHGLSIKLPGMVPRGVLNQLYNQSRMYVHLGGGGQNDRGCLEAMRCGLPVLLANPPRFAPFVYANPEFCRVVKNSDDPSTVATEIHDMLQSLATNDGVFNRCAEYYEKENGSEMAFEKIAKLFGFLKTCPIANRLEILRIYGFQ